MGAESQLFQTVVALSGLSEVFAADSVERACARAGVEGRILTPANLPTVLPHLTQMMRIFLGQAEAGKRTEQMAALLKDASGEASR